MKIKLGFFALLFVFAGSHAYSQGLFNNYYLPQVAIGSFGGGSFRTTFVFFNNHSTAATVMLSLTDDSGGAMSATIPGLGTNSVFTFGLAPGATLFYQTDASGALRAGAATVSSTAPIGVSGIFTVYDPQGNFVTESGVANSEPMTSFVIPIDASGNYNTGLALFNPDSADSSLTAVLLDTGGNEVARTTKTLVAGGHMAFFAAGAGQLFPNVSNLQGTLSIESSAAISAMGLRQNSSPISYTSLPVVSKSSTQTTMSLAQVANGVFGGGSFRTSFLIFSTSSSTANVSLTLTKDDSTPFPVTIPGQGTNSTFNFSIAAGRSLFLQTDGTGALAAGAAIITSDVPIGASGIFTVYDQQGNFQTEAGVGDSTVLTQFTLPVDMTGQFDTGVAFFNPGTSSVTMTLRFMNSEGVNSSLSPTITLAPNGHSAAFVSQLFPGTTNVQGSLAITATGGVAALTLRQNNSPYGLTTLPVTSGTAPGTTAAEVLLSQTQTGVDATSPVTVNKTLPPGLLLSGTIQGGSGYYVVAQSGSNIFSGAVNFLTGRYVVVVPAGTYTVKVVFSPTAVGQQFVLMTYTYPSQVEVPSDTTLNMTLPSPTLFSVSGSVSGIGTIPGLSGTPNLRLTSNDNSTEAQFPISSGAYQGSVPAGTYLVSITADNFPSGGLTENLSIYSVGTLTVSGDTTADYTVPNLVTLSGTANLSGMTPTAGVILATDTANLSNDILFISAPRASNVTFLTGFTGAYQLLLPQNRTYSMNISYEPTIVSGVVSFPVTTSTVDLAGNSTYNFTVPSLPGLVTVNGQVTNNSGTGVADVSVTAFSQSVTGASDTSFSASGTTDQNGNYSFSVLSGTNYQLQFVPRTPTP